MRETCISAGDRHHISCDLFVTVIDGNLPLPNKPLSAICPTQKRYTTYGLLLLCRIVTEISLKDLKKCYGCRSPGREEHHRPDLLCSDLENIGELTHV